MKKRDAFKSLRKDFPILQETGAPFIYFDNAATTHKPLQVIEAITNFYAHQNASVGRGLYPLAEQATTLYEKARTTCANFLHVQHASEIVITHGATDAFNMVEAAWARTHVAAGQTIVITALEHHSNLLVWQRCAQQTKAELVVIPTDTQGNLPQDLDTYITEHTALVAVCHVSNTLGNRIDVRQLAQKAHAVGARILVDATQSVPHGGVNVQELECDMLIFSGHKIMGPTGIGILYIRRDMHDQLVPYQLGGGMVYSVDYKHVSWREMPYLLEAGTPPIAQAIGLTAALEYITHYVDPEQVKEHEAALTSYAIDQLAQLPGIRLLGPLAELKQQGHLISFVCEKIHAHDVAAYLGTQGICVRAGNHCAQPVSQIVDAAAFVRVSFYWYNTMQEIDTFVSVLKALLESY